MLTLNDLMLTENETSYQIQYVLDHNALPLAVLLRPLSESVSEATAKKALRVIVEWLQNNDIVCSKEIMQETPCSSCENFWEVINKLAEED